MGCEMRVFYTLLFLLSLVKADDYLYDTQFAIYDSPSEENPITHSNLFSDMIESCRRESNKIYISRKRYANGKNMMLKFS